MTTTGESRVDTRAVCDFCRFWIDDEADRQRCPGDLAKSLCKELLVGEEPSIHTYADRG